MSLRRFIAGAVCPQCNGMDKIYVTQENDEDVALCTQCDYRSVRPKDNDEPPAESVKGVIRSVTLD